MFELAAATSSDPGFIAQSWQILQTYWPMFLRGAGVTLLIAITGTLTGSVIGLIIGMIRTIPVNPTDSKLKKGLFKVINWVLSVYIEIFRGTPMIVQAMVIFLRPCFCYGEIHAGITGRFRDCFHQYRGLYGGDRPRRHYCRR